MKIGRISRFLMFASASLFLHAAALSVARHFIPRGRAPITEVANRNIHPVELYSPRIEPVRPTFKPRISVQDFKLPASPQTPEPVSPPLEKPLIAPRRRSDSRSAELVPLPPPPESAELSVAVSIPVEAPVMPVGYFLAHPGGLATEPTSQEVIREVALESTRRDELAPSTPALRPLNTGESKDQLISEGCWETPRGLQCPSWHPANQPQPVYQETEDGFIVGMRDPSVTNGDYRDRRYQFHRQEDGSYLYQDPDGRNWIKIYPDGRMEDNTSAVSRPEDRGLLYPVFDIFSGALPWDRPPIPHYQWSEVEESTREVRVRLAEQNDMANVNEALSGLHQELLGIIKKHLEWSIADQHDFLFRRWDECREDSVGNEARTSIEEFIRHLYPPGTPREITEEELRDFNVRRETESQSFCPYGCLPGLELAEPQVGDSL